MRNSTTHPVSTFFASVARPKTVRASTVPVMTKQRKPRAAKPRDLSFGAVQRKLAEEGAAAAAASPRAKKKAAPLQIEKLIDKRRNPKNQSRWEVRARSPDRSPPSHLRHTQYLVRWRGFGHFNFLSYS